MLKNRSFYVATWFDWLSRSLLAGGPKADLTCGYGCVVYYAYDY